MADTLRRTPLVTAGVLLGIGLGGFADGIVFHQILQVHNMLSHRIPPTDLVAVKINMTWDGYFHAAVWLITLSGIYQLFRAGQQRDVLWSGKMLFGAWILGWGLFNFVEGIIDHQLLALHHVMEYARNPLPYDLAFLASGIGLILVGSAMIRASSKDALSRETAVQ